MKKIILTPFLFFTLLIAANAQTDNTPDALMLRFPDVSASEITFVYAEDVWTVPKDGGLARRITSTPGIEAFPKFSPDGSSIAFSGNYVGNKDVYTISNIGSDLKRLTFHPGGENVIDWQPDGEKVLFASRRKSPSNRFNQFYTVDVNGGDASQLPLFYAELGSFNADGSKLAYQYLNRAFRTWKRYQGGTASDIWIYDFESKSSEKITDYQGTDAFPMWNGNSIYYMSDQGPKHKLNLWVYDTDAKSNSQVTFFEEYDIKFPSMGPEDIVFENGGGLYLYNYSSKTSTKVEIEVPSEQINLLAQLKDLNSNINSYWISPNGKRALFDARGELVTVPAEYGNTVNLTNTSGVAEHSPDWSPDGKLVAYFSDAEGEYNLYTRKADGTGTATKLTSFTEDYFQGTKWSPDSKKIAFHDQKGNLFIIKLSSKKVIEVDKNEVFEITDYSWSPDSEWLVFSSATDAALFNTGISVYQLASSKLSRLTDGFYSAGNPVFSQDGEYLFYTSNQSFTPLYSDYDVTWIYSNSTVLIAVPLKKDTPSIIAPRNDNEEVAEEEKEEAEEEKKDKKKKGDDDGEENTDKGVVVKIDLEGFEARGSVLPIPAGSYGNLYTTEGKLIFSSRSLSPRGGGPEMTALKYYDIESRETEDIIAGITGFEMSAKGEKMIYSSNGGSFGIIDVGAGAKVGDGAIDMSGMQAYINPKEEWNQIFYEAWRLERDYFYDPNMHGVDWDAIKTRYSKLLPYCSSRSDLNYIIGEMIGELNVGHAYIGGGDNPRAKRVGVGMLGIDFVLVENAYKIEKIYAGAEFEVDVRSPLNDPGVDVKEGDYILAVNHIPVDPNMDPYASFQHLDGKLITLTVNSSPTMNGSRDVDVKTIGNESKLRNRAWIEANRQKVLEATDGKCGYIYVPNTGTNGQNELVRQYQGQVNKAALIIDERFNSGGQIPDRFIEMLNRPNYNYWGRRGFKSWPTPFVSNNGPKVMLANEWAGSGGDAFPYYFKAAKIGPVVGKRTWGGLVGITGLPPLLDGGFISSPNFGMYDNDGEWAVEGYGVDPDYEVENTSDAVYRGDDAQLDKAIELILEGLQNQPEEVEKPTYPVKTGIGNN